MIKYILLLILCMSIKISYADTCNIDYTKQCKTIAVLFEDVNRKRSWLMVRWDKINDPNTPNNIRNTKESTISLLNEYDDRAKELENFNIQYGCLK